MHLRREDVDRFGLEERYGPALVPRWPARWDPAELREEMMEGGSGLPQGPSLAVRDLRPEVLGVLLSRTHRTGFHVKTQALALHE